MNKKPNNETVHKGIAVYVPVEAMKRVEAFREAQLIAPSRSAAFVYLLDRGLEAVQSKRLHAIKAASNE